MEAVDRPPPHPPYTLLGLLIYGPTDHFSSSRSPSRSFAAGIDASLFLSLYIERGSVLLQWLGLVLVTVFLLRRLLGFLRLWEAAKSIPGPPWGSFFGDKRGYHEGENINDYLAKMHERYGSVVKIWLNPVELLVSFNDPLAIVEVLVKVKDKFPLFGRALRLAFGRSSLFAPLYEEVKPRRELLEFNLNKHLMGKSKIISFEVLKRVLERDHPIIFEKSLDCYSISQHFAFYFLGATLFGSSFFLWQNVAVYEELLINLTKDANLLVSNKIPPIWRRQFWRYCWLCLKLKYLTLELIQKCAEDGNLSGQICQIHNEKSATFCLNAAANEGLHFKGVYQCLISEEEPCGNIIGVMFHGFLRVANIISHVLSRLMLQPKLQEQIYLEVKEIQARASGPNQYDVQNMQLLMSTVYESIRLLPVGPLLQRCSMKQVIFMVCESPSLDVADINFRSGVTVPEGALLIVPAQLVQKDQSLWGSDACKFSPQRFFPEAGRYAFHDAEMKAGVDLETPSSCRGMPEEKKKPDKYLLMDEESKIATFVSFGLGPRDCVGQKLVIYGVSTLLASLLLQYQVQRQPEFPSHLERKTSGPEEQNVPNQKMGLLKRNPQGWFP